MGSGLALLALVLSFALTGQLVRWSPALGLVDKPRDRRLHGKETPNSGGIAILIALGVTFLTYYATSFGKSISGALYWIYIGTAFIGLLGFWDDLKELSAVFRLIGMALICSLVIIYQDNRVYDFTSLSDIAVFTLHLLWYMFLINAFNLIDGIDGLSTLTGFFTLLSLGFIQFQIGVEGEAALLAIIGAMVLLGFLPWNFPKAKIFLGNGGSAALGFLVAALTSYYNTRSTILPALILPIILVGYPLLDMGIVAVNRLKRGQHPFSGDRSHLHHRLNRLTGSPSNSLTLIAILHGLACLQAVLLVPFLMMSVWRITILMALNFTGFIFIILRLEKSIRRQVMDFRSKTSEIVQFQFLHQQGKESLDELLENYRECRIDISPTLDGMLFEEKERAHGILTSVEELLRSNTRSGDHFFRGASSGEFVLLLQNSPKKVDVAGVKNRFEELLNWFFEQYNVKGPHDKMYKINISEEGGFKKKIDSDDLKVFF